MFPTFASVELDTPLVGLEGTWLHSVFRWRKYSHGTRFQLLFGNTGQYGHVILTTPQRRRRIYVHSKQASQHAGLSLTVTLQHSARFTKLHHSRVTERHCTNNSMIQWVDGARWSQHQRRWRSMSLAAARRPWTTVRMRYTIFNKALHTRYYRLSSRRRPIKDTCELTIPQRSKYIQLIQVRHNTCEVLSAATATTDG
jgi:hypothetical protein